jgi:hypothetical protein
MSARSAILQAARRGQMTLSYNDRFQQDLGMVGLQIGTTGECASKPS